MDRNDNCGLVDTAYCNVALRKESVDRNICIMLIVHNSRVALRKESVDRNNDDFSVESGEMVALRKESVDRNIGVMHIVQNR